MRTRSSDLLVIALCGLATLFDGYDLQVLGLAAPGMASSLHVDPARLGPALAATLAGAAIGAMAIAPIADRKGRRPLLVVAMLAMAIPSIVTSFATSISLIAVMRFLTGLGLGAAVPVATALAAERAGPERRTFVVAAVTACAAIGALIASLSAPAIERAAGWRALFIVGAVLPLLASALFRAFLPPPDSTAPDVQRNSSPAPLFAAPFRRHTILLWIAFGSALFASAALTSWLPTLLIEMGWVKADAQRMIGLLAGGGLLGGLLLSWMIDRTQSYWPLPVGLGCAAAAALLFQMQSAPTAIWLVDLLVLGVGVIGSLTLLSALTARTYPSQLRSTGIGWAGGVGRILSVFGPLTLGLLMGAHFPARTTLAVLAAPLLLCAGAAAALVWLKAVPDRPVRSLD